MKNNPIELLAGTLLDISARALPLSTSQQEQESMTFPDAISEVFREGSRITRRTWNNSRIYGTLELGQLHITFPLDGSLHPWIIREEDYFADDWEVVE